jgi:hypothetical protein
MLCARPEKRRRLRRKLKSSNDLRWLEGGLLQAKKHLDTPQGESYIYISLFEGEARSSQGTPAVSGPMRTLAVNEPRASGGMFGGSRALGKVGRS